MGVILLRYEQSCCKKRNLVVTKMGAIDWRVQKNPSGFTKNPAFLQPPRNCSTEPTPSSIIYSYKILGNKERKMSQSFNNNSNSFNTNISFSTTYINPAVADERPNILAWLSRLDPKLRHQDIRDRRARNIGEWVLQTEEFRSWYAGSGGGESDNSFLFCYGDPGVGKTYIRYNNTNEPLRIEEREQVLTGRDVSSVVIDNLCDQVKGQNATVACFYFDFAAQNEQSPACMMGSLLKQLVFGLEEIPEEISKAYKERKNAIGGQGPQVSNILKMLQTTSARKRAFICIDALDECATEHRVKLLDSLGQLLQQSPGTRIFMTGRRYIEPEIGRHLSGRVTSLSISPKRHDIVTYIHSRLAADTTPDAMDSTLEADILKKIPSDISEMYVEVITLRKLLSYQLTDTYLDFC